MSKLKIVCSLVAGLALLGGTNLALAAERPTQDQIIKALTPAPKKPLTRSLTMTPADQAAVAAAAEDKKFIDSMRKRTTRSLSFDERDRIATIAKDQPAIDLEIKFNFNSASIAPQAMADVDALGKALSNPSLKGGTFFISGHTDAVGSEGSNLDLSNRRADTIKKVLTEKYGIPAENLVTAGYGKTRLKNAAVPNAPENRRVQIVNMADKVAER
jgi:outer membrane protein OmpA-like peptidoglycan-associated protein